MHIWAAALELWIRTTEGSNMLRTVQAPGRVAVKDRNLSYHNGHI